MHKLNKYKKFLVPGEPIFQDRKGAALTRNAYGKRLRTLFLKRYGKKVGASLLRNIYLSDQYKNMPSLNKIDANANNMMHSITTALKYVKK